MAKSAAKKKQAKQLRRVELNRREKTARQNPFELKFNRLKRQVIGRDASVVRGGLPGVSRRRAVEHRKSTLLSEYRRFGKENRIVDKRLGERERSLDADEKLTRRFTLERQKRASESVRTAVLDSDAALTHAGRSLEEIERHERPLAADDDDAAELLGEFVERAHFGGGADDDGDSRPTRKDALADMIARSKLRRHERQAEREQLTDLTDRLDAQWKEALHGNLLANLAATAVATQPQDDANDFDATVRSLQFERRRTKATDRAKTPQESAKEERDRLHQLEEARLRRMRADAADTTSSEHRSADDLADNMAVDRRRLRSAVHFADQLPIERQGNCVNGIDEAATIDDGGDCQFDQPLVLDQPSNETVDDVPFVMQMPDSFESFLELLSNRSAVAQATIVERLTALYDPSLAAGNRGRLQKLFLFLLRYFDLTSSKAAVDCRVLDFLPVALFKLAKVCPTHAAKCFRALLRKQRAVVRRRRRRLPSFGAVAFLRLVPHIFPASDYSHPIVTPSLALLSHVLASVHIRCPAEAARGVAVCAVGLEYVAASKAYVPEVVAYLGGVFYAAVDHAHDERSPAGNFPISDPHRKMLYLDKKVVVNEAEAAISIRNLFAAETDDSAVTIVRCLSFACDAVGAASTVFAELPTYAEVFRPLAAQMGRLPTRNYPSWLAERVCAVKKQLEHACAASASRHLPVREKKQRKRKQIEMVEPRIEDNFDAEQHRRRPGGKRGVAADRSRLKHQYKRELRGTLRELRRDNAFLARESLREQSALDSSRKRKTRQIMRSLMGQEAAYKRAQFGKSANDDG